MSYLKDIQESPDTLKGLALSLLLMPFWYLTIFLVNHSLYTNSNFTILLTISFVLSVSSFAFTLSIAALLDNPKKPPDFILVAVFSVSMLWLWKVILLFIVYSMSFLFKKQLYLYSYIVIYFSAIFIMIIIALIINSRKNKRKNKIKN